MVMIGERQQRILDEACRQGYFNIDGEADRKSATLLHMAGYLARDPKVSGRFYPTSAARDETGVIAGNNTDAIGRTDCKIAVARRIDTIRAINRLRFTDEGKVASLMESIGKGGLRTPITVFGMEGDATADLSAGAHRMEACRRLGHETILCFHETGDDLDRQLWEIDENLIRSDLSQSERALFMARRKELYLIKYPETANGGDRKSDRKLCEPKNGNDSRFTAATAAATGRKERSIQLDVERGEKISATALRLLSGTRHDKGVTLDQIKRLETAEAQEQYARDLIAADKAIAAESKQIRTAQQADRREARLRMVSLIADHGKRAGTEFQLAAYPIIYADPPWPQDAWSEETGQDKGLKYPSMSIDDIKALCAGEKSPATQSAELWLWTTANRSKDAHAVMEAWGFEFVTEIIWDKIDIGMGRHVRDRHEKVLIGKRGPISLAPLPGTQPPSVYAEKKTAHSRKPVWFAEQIEKLWPNVRKLELFQRRESLAPDDVRLNGMWDFWGNQAGAPKGGSE